MKSLALSIDPMLQLPPQFVASAHAAEVEKRLRDVPPQEGEFGQYW